MMHGQSGNHTHSSMLAPVLFEPEPCGARCVFFASLVMIAPVQLLVGQSVASLIQQRRALGAAGRCGCLKLS